VDRKARPSKSSERPCPYEGATSQTVMPRSHAALKSLIAPRSSGDRQLNPPSCQVPNAISETRIPLLPSSLLYFSLLSNRHCSTLSCHRRGPAQRTMLIVALTGPSAVGKTSVTRLLAEKFDVLHESYMEQNVHGLDNRHVISKWAYIGAWFDSIYRRASAGCHVLLTDRSPYDTCAYVDHELSASLEWCAAAWKSLPSMDIPLRRYFYFVRPKK
jgi:hypothetical protein